MREWLDMNQHPQEVAMSLNDLNSALSLMPEKLAICPEHGEFVSKHYRIGKIQRWTQCQQCAAQARIEADEEARSKAAAERFNEAGVPLDLATVRWAKTPADPQHAGMIALAQRFSERHLKGDVTPNLPRTLSLLGTAGRGKTCIGVALIRDWCRHQKNAAYATAYMAEEWARLDSKERLDRIRRVRLLVLDEAGMESDTDFAKGVIRSTIHIRFDARLPTVLISQLSKDALLARYGMGIYDRLCSSGWLCETEGRSYRRVPHGD
jgi:DNA replication protein DnaC